MISVVTIAMLRIVKLLLGRLSSPCGHENVLAVDITCGHVHRKESLWTRVYELLFSVATKAHGGRVACEWRVAPVKLGGGVSFRFLVLSICCASLSSNQPLRLFCHL